MAEPPPRLDGAAAWAAVPPDLQAAIGAIALELVAALRGQAWALEGSPFQPEAARAFDAAASLLLGELLLLGGEAVPALARHNRPQEAVDPSPQGRQAGALPRRPPLPSRLGPVCRGCGCSDSDCCAEGCAWAEPDLCTSCAGKPDG